MKNRNLDHKDDWATPPDFLADIRAEFGGFFDPCPWRHDTEDWDGLKEPWREVNYINPPYSLKLKTAFVKKAATEPGLNIMLLPVSTSTRLFHEVIQPNAKEIRFLRGRLRFIGINSKGEFVNYDLINFEGVPEDAVCVRNSGMHDSMLVIFDNTFL